MWMRMMGTCLVGALALCGCKSDSGAKKEAAPASANAGGELKNKMGNCPSTVDGAATKVEDAADGVLVTVTSADAAQVTEIRARAARLVQSASAPTTGEHNRSGGSGGTTGGHCPVVVSGTVITVEDVDGGAKITVKPEKPEGLDSLKKETNARNAALPDVIKKLKG